MSENQIVVYQPNETVRLDVRLESDTVWLTQAQLCDLFKRDVSVISRHIKNIFTEGELEKESNLHFLQSANSDRPIALYSLDVIISVGYRVKSVAGTRFRQWATKVLKEYLLRGYSFNTRLNQLEDKVDRRLAKHDQDIVELKDKVDFFVQTSQPPVRGVFYNGQVFDAHVFAVKFILSAKKSILLIDSWVDVVTLELLAKKAKGVTVEIVTSRRGNKISASDTAKFNAQHGGLTITVSKNFHDRFLVIDDKTLYLVGASLKDLGWKCFAFTKLDSAEIQRLKARV
ncbi:MAG: virulence RhuM family protein [Kiritimatiellae bacterium]|nr:virulence RhuM family protein [Kiritimatiellia bacterium]